MGLFRRRSRWSTIKRAAAARTPDPADAGRAVASRLPGRGALRSGLVAVGATVGLTAASSAISSWRKRGQH